MHKRKRAKNYLLMALLVGLVGLFYYLTMLKIRGA